MTATATQVMEAEHRNIESVVKALGDIAVAIEKGQRADAAFLETAVQFFRVYADKLHHGKEEALFFPMLVKRGVPPQGCPIGGLNHEMADKVLTEADQKELSEKFAVRRL